MNAIETYNWRKFCADTVGTGSYGDSVAELWRHLWVAQAEADKLRAEFEGREIPSPIATMLDDTARVIREGKACIVALNIPLVHRIAHRTLQGPMRRDMDDAIQEGLIGLMRAVECYDDRGTTFSTFAWHIVRKAIKRWAARQQRQRLETLAPEDAAQLLEAVDDEPAQRDTIEMAREIARMAIENDANLTPREREAIIRYYGLDGASAPAEYLHVIAQDWGVSKQRVLQVRNAAEGKLREGWGDRMN